ncbi:MAG: carbon-nitrogen hydrolase family protein [Planctomycetes bacterium]|nr:carbon-nitrogen hydrolase family protein [Planctomycetota bacterium]
MTIAGVQMNVAFADKEQNLKRIGDRLREAALHGAQLVVFPECAVTGYCFESFEEARGMAEPIEGPAVRRIVEMCRAADAFAVVGMIEEDGPRIFNVCVLTGPLGLLGVYRKIHLPHLGLDNFSTPGDRPFQVWKAGPVTLGMNICYDVSFPESSRAMALAGAELIVLPTNWPPGAGCLACYATNTRAMENHVYYLAANRVGEERGFRFIGQSRICEPNGETIASADETSETILYAEINPAIARNKHLVRVPGKHEIHRFRDRRPEMYGPLVEPVRD